jgi:hypothetical protein
MDDKLEDATEVGLCCLAGADETDSCGSCFDTAWADPTSSCSKSEKACMACGPQAVWCSGDAGSVLTDQDDAATKKAEQGSVLDPLNVFHGLIRKFEAPGGVPERHVVVSPAAAVSATALTALVVALLALRRRGPGGHHDWRSLQQGIVEVTATDAETSEA